MSDGKSLSWIEHPKGGEDPEALGDINESAIETVWMERPFRGMSDADIATRLRALRDVAHPDDPDHLAEFRETLREAACRIEEKAP